MATRKEQKAHARAERVARAEAAASAEARRKRLFLFGAVALVAVVIVAALIAITSGSGTGSTGSAAGQAAQVRRLLAGIPQAGQTLGSPKAPVVVTLYEDLECPVCRAFTLGGANELIDRDVRSGRVRVVFRSLQTATPDPTTFEVQQEAALAAGDQNRLWHFVELFYHEQGPEGTPYVTESYLAKLARQVPGLDLRKWNADRSAGALSAQVSADAARARAAGFNSTPTIVVQGPKANPQPLAGDAGYSDIEKLVKQAGG